MRAIVLSHAYADPSTRQKLREIAGLDWSITLALPGGVADMDGAIRVAPIAVSGALDQPEQLRWHPRALRRLLTDVRPDILHVEEEPWTPAAHVAIHEALKLEIPSVVFSWESLARRLPLFHRRRYARTTREACGVIGVNRLAERLLAQAAPGVPTLSLPQRGVSPPASVERPTRDPLAMACVGRLVPERGVDLLLRVCGQLMGPWTLAIAGTGPEQEALEAQAQRLGLASRIRWLGAISRAQVTALWGEVDVLVVPSRSTPTWVEPYSAVLLEAMAHGVAAVVTSEGALPELVGDAGMVVREEEDLLVALQELVTTPSRRAALGQAGRRRVLDRYDDRALARATSGFWKEVIARSHAPTRR